MEKAKSIFILIIAIVGCIYFGKQSCNEIDSKSDAADTTEIIIPKGILNKMGNKRFQIEPITELGNLDGCIEIFTIDSCQYIFVFRMGEIAIAHKGNCINSAHKPLKLSTELK